MSWEPYQRQVLAAMGFTPVQQVSAAPVPDDPLLLALLRAAGRDLQAPDAAALCRQWLALGAGLRTPAGKRALWPRLRALRRQAPA